MFTLHPQLAHDTLTLGRFSLCRLLLMKDARYPWFILVPERADIREIHQLDEADQQQLMRESSLLARTLAALFAAHKMNIAALGNVVPQLHVHHIVRHPGDDAWPAPVWGKLPAVAYTEEAMAAMKERVVSALPELTPL